MQYRALAALVASLGVPLIGCAEGSSSTATYDAGGVPDASEPLPDDAAGPDAAVADAEPGAADAAPADASVADARPPDARPTDARPTDARPADAGVDARVGPLIFEFQDGVKPTTAYRGTTDAEILERMPTVNAATRIGARVDGNDEGAAFDMHTVMRWELTGIPSGARVRRVVVALTLIDWPGILDAYDIMALRRAWDEGAVTWERALAQQLWQVGGAGGASDVDTTIFGSIAALSNGPVTIELNAAGVAAVQRWVDDPATNFGFLYARDSASDGLEIATREHAIESERPRLIVEIE